VVGKVPIHGPGPHTTQFLGIARHLDRNIAIFAIHAAKSVEPRACSTPNAGCRNLFRRFHVPCWVNDRSSALIHHPISAKLFNGHMTYKVGDHAAWMNGERPNAIAVPYGIESNRKERVCTLRLSVGDPRVIVPVLESGVLKIYRSPPVSDRGQRNHVCALRTPQGWPEPSCKLEMSQVVGGELRFVAARIARKRRSHYPCVVDQDVELFVASKELFREGVY